MEMKFSMFKFLKSKKGFTLVELMIVVVIMAILVAVAVPIFTAVIDNAQRKTCAANKREILSQLTNYCIGNNKNTDIFNDNDRFVITFDGSVGEVTTGGEYIEASDIEALFQEIPYCPIEESEYEVVLTKGTGSPIITITCTVHDATE